MAVDATMPTFGRAEARGFKTLWPGLAKYYDPVSRIGQTDNFCNISSWKQIGGDLRNMRVCLQVQ